MMKMMNSILRRAYAISPLRKSFKLLVMFIGVKALLDGAEWHYVKYFDQIKFPRHSNVQGYQNPLNPPLPQPYPFPNNFDELKALRFNAQFSTIVFDQWLSSSLMKIFIYNDHPSRENPDIVDMYYEYNQHWKRDSHMKIRVLKRMTQEGITIPEGINQRIRELQQPLLDVIHPIVPDL